jgi:sulfur-oxidizing protein SoxA
LRVLAIGLTLACWAVAGPVAAQDVVGDQRSMLIDINPGELWIQRGEALFRERRGPKNVSLERCDFGLGPGVVAGAFAQMPRYFADARRVMDLESRIVWCMKTLQGFADEDEAIRLRHSTADREADVVLLATYVATQSTGMSFQPRQDHPLERRARDLGEYLFHRRMGPMDFSCATCHGHPARRVRLQSLFNIQDREQAARAASWPAYRIGQGTVRTAQHRLADCFWQMRLPELQWGSDLSVAFISYWTHAARGGVIQVPDLKR